MTIRTTIITKSVCFLILFFSQLTNLYAQSSSSALPYNQAQLEADLQQVLQKYVMSQPGKPFTDDKVPGVSASIRYLRNQAGNEVTFNLVHGYSNPHAKSTDCPTCPIVMDEDMIFELGSTTKAMTGASILLWMQDNVRLNGATFNLDTDLYQVLPAITGDRINGQASTRQIMDMTAGIPEFQLGTTGAAPSTHPIIDTGDPKEPTSPARFWTQTDVYAVVGYPTTVPGQSWSYCNTNYVILGQYLQGLNNYANIADAYNHKLFDPYGLDHIYMAGFEPIPSSEVWAMGWTGAGDNALATSRTAFYSAYWSAGAMVGRADDLAHFALLMWNSQNSIIQQPLYDEMMKMIEFSNLYQQVEDIQWNGYGLATMRVTVENEGNKVTLYGHNGETGGYLTGAFYLDDRQVAFSIILNGGGTLSNKTMVYLERDFTKTLLKYQRPN